MAKIISEEITWLEENGKKSIKLLRILREVMGMQASALRVSNVTLRSKLEIEDKLEKARVKKLFILSKIRAAMCLPRTDMEKFEESTKLLQSCLIKRDKINEQIGELEVMSQKLDTELGEMRELEQHTAVKLKEIILKIKNELGINFKDVSSK